MTGSDLILVVPWLIFAVCLAVLCARLVRSRRSAPRQGDRLHGICTRRRPFLHTRRRSWIP